MPYPLEYVVKDALMLCDKGAAPGMFTPTYNLTTKVNGCLVSTKADKIPLVNIPTFGACACKGGAPCTPTPVEWLDTYKAKVKGQETVLFRCKLPCASGGKVEFITSGQVPLPPDEYDKLLEEHGEDEDGLSWWDAAEMIPFAGGVIGVVRSAKKGDLLGVGLSLVSIGLDVGGLFSFGGGNAASAAVKGAKLARVGTKVANAMTKAGRAVRLTGTAARAFASAAAKMVDDLAIKYGKICVFACFPAGTPISVKDGYKNIEDVQVGDLVWAYNEETGESDLKPVMDTIQNEVDATIKITLEDEVIESTVEHPFFTRGGWKDAADLTTEDEIKTKNGAWSYIKKVVFEYQQKKVYNFEVADWHTYFVGAWEWLVHNERPCLSQIKHLPEWLARMQKGNYFNFIRESFYRRMGGFNEVVLETGKRLDSYIPGIEIVSRKFTQLANVTEKTAKGYIDELVAKYAPGTAIRQTARNADAIAQGGAELVGQMILEVPTQAGKISNEILEYATENSVAIRDVVGNILNP